GERVQKIPINAGFSCPNRDGTLSSTGCTYCLNEAFSPFYCDPENLIQEQLREGIHFFSKKYKARKFVAYFQSFSNTHGSYDDLEKTYSIFREFPGILGAIIATRPDCLDKEKLEILTEIFKERYLGLEFGIETSKDSTLKRVNRLHSFRQTIEAINLASKYDVHIGGHVIIGLPGETWNDFMETAIQLSLLPLHSLKIHHLQIIKGTPMALDFGKDPKDFPTFSAKEYVAILSDFIERLNPSIMLDRLSTRAPRHLLISPRWGGLKESDILAIVEKTLQQRESWQGRLFKILD
ncbi:TIGR01212 family radical SAM protein, partial [bacterium]|nr:TIGR01212 family radical SAM protein [bacterium]